MGDRGLPKLAFAVALALVSAAPLSGQDAPADTAGAGAPRVLEAEALPVDSIVFGLAPSDTIPVLAPRFREGRGVEELAAVPGEDVLPRNPRNAAIRSFLVPGWGQIYTGHPWRAALFAAGETGFFYMGYRKQREALDKKGEIADARAAFLADPPEGAPEDSLALEEEFRNTLEFRQLDAELEAIEERREDFYAWGLLSVIFAAVDAYAAAQLDPIDVAVDPVERRVYVGMRLPLPDDRPASADAVRRR